MAVMINISELKDILELTPSTQNIMLVGKHGIGKSEILTSYFKSKGMKVVTLFLGQMSDPGDIIGLPSRVEKKDAEGNVTSQTDFTPPYWFPVDGKPIDLFLDELNRTSRDSSNGDGPDAQPQIGGQGPARRQPREISRERWR